MIATLLLAIALAPAPPTLQSRVRALVAAYPGHVALFAKNLRTGATVGVDADRPVQTASVIKLTLMLEAFEQVRAGKLALGQPLVLTKANQVEGSGILQVLTPGLQLSLRDTIALMMTLSDNSATNMVIDAVGLGPTNAMIAGMGLKSTYFYKKVFQPPVGPQPPDQKQFGLGKTTPREIARVLESIYDCDLGEPALCREMIRIMRSQQYRAMAPRYLDDAAASGGLSPIADKVGEEDDVRNDVALIYGQSGPMIVATFTYGNPDHSWGPDNQAEILVGRVAKTIVDAWSPGGLAKAIPDELGSGWPRSLPKSR